MSAPERLDRYQRRHGRLGFPLAVVYKFFDDRGPQMAASITYYGFVALFPLLLLSFSATGFVLDGDPSLRRELEISALKGLPVIGNELRRNISTFHGSGLGLTVGVLGTLYGGTGGMQAAQAAFNHIYGVPRNEQPNPLRSRLRSLTLLGVLGSAVLLSTGVAVALSTANGLSKQLGPLLQALGYLFSLLLAVALFTGAFQLLTARTLRSRDVLRGGVLAAVCWELLQIFGATFVANELKHANALYGSFALVLGAIGWIYLQAIILIICAEVNVVLQFRLWPRALLTPFTDAVVLTDADRRAYALYAATQRFKGFERVEAHFRAPAGPAEPAPAEPAPGEPGAAGAAEAALAAPDAPRAHAGDAEPGAPDALAAPGASGAPDALASDAQLDT